MRLKKIIIVILLIQILILNLFAISSITSQPQIGNDDELDQSQPYYDFYCGVGCDCCKFAQSFVPTLELVTRVELFMNGSATLSIKNDLNGSDLTSVYAEKDSLNEWDWVVFDFDDILINPGQTYFIIWSPDDTGHSWGCKDYNIYENGVSYYFDCDEWSVREGDFTFKTYGRNTTASKPIINGPKEGIIQQQYSYMFTSNDPDDDNLFYYIDWGDGNSDAWIGPYDSGKEISISHTWEEKGYYYIKTKVKDDWGAESEWSDPYTVYMAAPNIKIITIKGGFGLTVEIKNIGDAAAENISYSLDIDGLILVGGEKSGTILTLGVNQSTIIKFIPIIGFGKALLTISVGHIVEEVECMFLGPFVIVL